VKYRAACSAPNYDNADFYGLMPCKGSGKKFLAAKRVPLRKSILPSLAITKIRIAKGGNHGIIYRSDDTGSKTGCNPL